MILFKSQQPKSRAALQTQSSMHSQDVDLKVIAQTYELGRKIDEGAFGKIYKAHKISSSEQYAVKLEPMKAEFPQLIFECKLYLNLHSDPTAADKGFPMVFECGV
jgi:hypothetical protein